MQFFVKNHGVISKVATASVCVAAGAFDIWLFRMKPKKPEIMDVEAMLDLVCTKNKIVIGLCRYQLLPPSCSNKRGFDFFCM